MRPLFGLGLALGAAGFSALPSPVSAAERHARTVMAPPASGGRTEAPAPVVAPPRWNGRALFGTGTLTAAVGMGLHAFAAWGVTDNCAVVENPSDLLPSAARKLGIGDVLDSTFLANIDVICSPEVILPLGARVLVPAFSAGSIAQIAAGGAFRGDASAYEDTLVTRSRHNAAAAIGVGSTLMLGGAVLWAVSRGMLVENRTGCDDITCLAWFDFGTFQGSSVLFAAGSGILAHGLSYRKSRSRYERLDHMGMRPMLSQNSAGVMLDGRF